MADLLQSQPSLASTKDAVKALDKVHAATATAIALIESAAAGRTPEALELVRLLEENSATPADEKHLKVKLTELLGKLPLASKKLSKQENLGRIAELAVRQGKAQGAIALIQQYVNRVIFDVSSSDKYELLKQIRKLGRMDLSAKKAAKTWLLSAPDKVNELCDAAGISTTAGKARKPVSTTSLVTKLMQHGERYAENAGD
ncbi:MAG: hypothetical protein B7Z37_26405 [Verrucomicrobia bacterium 12-59-8]|nr:MAG: hypothetical protein B7Z37_26405 [Verrucomicrobia bacterium 12-59-8]